MKSAAIRAVFHLRKTKESSVAWKCDRKIELRYKTVIPYRCRSLASFGGRGGDNLAAKASRRRRRIRTKELEQGYTDPPTRKRCSRTTERRYRDDSGRYPVGSSREGYPVTSSYRSRNRSMLLYVVFSFHDRAFSRGLWGKARRSRATAPLFRSGSVAFANRGHLLSLPPIPARYARSSFFVIRSVRYFTEHRETLCQACFTLYRRLVTANDVSLFRVSTSILVCRVSGRV